MTESNPVTELKKIDFALKSFKANGKEYFIEQSYSYDRYRMYRKFQILIGYGVELEQFLEQDETVIRLLNSEKKVEAGVIIYNRRQGLKDALDDTRIDPVMMMCALFMNTADEDRRFISLEQIRVQIDDWIKEGIAMESFFYFAISLIPNFIKHYESITQDTSLKEAAMQE